MSSLEQTIKVGIGVLILRDEKILLGKRKGSHGAEQYAFPGGHLEYGEGFAECARREVMEETGLEIENVRFQFLANVLEYLPKHYVHIGITADAPTGAPEVCEPEKCESWGWFEIDKLPEPMFKPCLQHLESYRTGQQYYDVYF